MQTAMTNRELLQWAVAELGTEKRMEAELLLCHVLDTNRALLLAHDTDLVVEEKAEAYRNLIARRKADEPFQYLLGTANFMGLDLLVTPDVLIPRFDTERLVEQALELLRHTEKPVVLDICTGSGAIALAINHYKIDAIVYAGDISEQALCIAKENNARCGTHVLFRQGNLTEPFSDLAGKVYLLVSNPPYITTNEMQALPADVQQEPHLALWGGEDGLMFYRTLVANAPALLLDGGWLTFEIGWQQGNAVQELLVERGFQNVAVLQDWQGKDRVVIGQWFVKNEA